jgi:hypothetical protein
MKLVRDLSLTKWKKIFLGSIIFFALTLLILDNIYDIFIKENTFNCLCQEEKDLRLEEKGILSDKLKAKEYLNQNFPEIKYAKVLEELNDPEQLKNITLPENFVMKYSTGARMFELVTNNNYQIEDLLKKAKGYTNINFSTKGYRSIPFLNFKEPHYDYNKEPKVFIEEFLEGICEFRIMMVMDKILYCEKIKNKNTEVYDKDWNQIPCPRTGKISKPEKNEKPKCFEKILEFCKHFYEKEKFNLMRMDFYLNEDEDQFYFGEFTFTPENCRKKYTKEFNKKYRELVNW